MRNQIFKIKFDRLMNVEFSCSKRVPPCMTARQRRNKRVKSVVFVGLDDDAIGECFHKKNIASPRLIVKMELREAAHFSSDPSAGNPQYCLGSTSSIQIGSLNIPIFQIDVGLSQNLANEWRANIRPVIVWDA